MPPPWTKERENYLWDWKRMMTSVDISDITGRFAESWGMWVAIGVCLALLAVAFFIFREAFMFGPSPLLAWVAVSVMGLVITGFVIDASTRSKVNQRVIAHYGFQPPVFPIVPKDGMSFTVTDMLVAKSGGGWQAPQDVTLTHEGNMVTAWVVDAAGDLVPLSPANM